MAAVVPANGAQDADPVADVVVDFSERMRHATLTGGAIKLKEQGSGAVVATTRSIEELPDPDDDGPLGPFTRVVLSHPGLASERLYLVEVLKSVEDLAGVFGSWRSKVAALLELMGLGYSDTSFSVDEKSLVTTVADQMGLTPNELAELEEWVREYVHLIRRALILMRD